MPAENEIHEVDGVPIVPIQSIDDRGWEPRPVQVAPPRWSPPGPWEPDDPEAFMRGWAALDEAE